MTLLSAAFPERKYLHFAVAPGARKEKASGKHTLPRMRKVNMRFESNVARRDHQVLQICSRTMRSPFLQPNALANSAMFESGPSPRKRGKG